MKSILLFLFIFISFAASAEIEHKLLRRLAVFPIADANLATAEDSWWQMREMLTKDPKFLVASRRFMINRGVFQPRKQLKPADAIILGKILDAQALVVTALEDRTLKMKVYDAENGYLLWESDLMFHPAIPINDQLIRVSTKLIQDFMTAIPYQGFQVKEPGSNRLLYEAEGKATAHVFIGTASEVQVGDTAQWVKVTSDVGQAFFNSARITVIAEGEVKAVKGDQVQIEIKKMRDPKDFTEFSLVRFPKELQRLKDTYSTDERGAVLSNEYLSGDIKSAQEFKQGNNSTSTSLAFIASIAAYILIAF